MRLMQPTHKNKIPNIHTLRPHHNTQWIHITCTNITPTKYTNLWKCALHTTHAAPAQPTHLTNATNQSLTISTQTTNAPTDSTPGTPDNTTNSLPAVNQPILSNPQTAPATSASKPATLQTASTNSAPTPSTPQITNHQQSQSAQQNKQDLKILQININGIHKKTHRTGTHHEDQQHRYYNSTRD